MGVVYNKPKIKGMGPKVNLEYRSLYDYGTTIYIILINGSSI